MFKIFRKKERNKKKLTSILINKGSHLDSTTRFINGFSQKSNLDIGENSIIDRNVEFDISCGHIKIGDGTYIHSGASIYGNVTIGDYCLISKNLYASSGSHSLNKPCYIRYSDRIKKEKTTEDSIKIDDDVWIGYNVFIKNGVRIGKGAVIGALSAVTRDVPPYAIVGGVPARLIRNRFEFIPSREIISSEKNHFPFFYSGFDQANIEFSFEGYRVKNNKISVAVPIEFDCGYVLIEGVASGNFTLALSESGYISKNNAGVFSLEYNVKSEHLTNAFKNQSLIYFDVTGINNEIRIKKISFL